MPVYPMVLRMLDGRVESARLVSPSSLYYNYHHHHIPQHRAELHLSPEERLPADVISFILNSDTTFISTSYQEPPNEADRFPSHVGINKRPGHAGFSPFLNGGVTFRFVRPLRAFRQTFN